MNNYELILDTASDQHLQLYVLYSVFFYSVLFEMTFIPRPEENLAYLIRHFTHYEWPFEMLSEIFG